MLKMLSQKKQTSKQTNKQANIACVAGGEVLFWGRKLRSGDARSQAKSNMAEQLEENTPPHLMKTKKFCCFYCSCVVVVDC